MAEPEARQAAQRQGVLVIARGQAQPIGEAEAKAVEDRPRRRGSGKRPQDSSPVQPDTSLLSLYSGFNTPSQ